MRSFVLWYEPINKEEKEERIKLDVHINLWKKDKTSNLLYKEDEIFIFDFGFMISDIKKLKKLSFYVPFKISKFEDLGKILLKSTDLIEAIFNEECKVSTFHPGRKQVNIQTKKEFIIYSLSNHQLKRKEINEDNHKGEILTFDLSDVLSDEECHHNKDISKIKQYYIRFRLKVKKKNIFMIKKQDTEENPFTNIFRRTEIIDFRINDLRTCSEDIKEEFARKSKFLIEKIHYLLLRNANDEFLYHDGKVNSRILEDYIWKDYMEDLNKDLVAYHLKEKISKEPKTVSLIEIKKAEKINFLEVKENTEAKEIKSFSKLVRFNYPETNIKSFLICSFYLVLIGFLSTIIYNKIFIK